MGSWFTYGDLEKNEHLCPHCRHVSYERKEAHEHYQKFHRIPRQKDYGLVIWNGEFQKKPRKKK